MSLEIEQGNGDGRLGRGGERSQKEYLNDREKQHEEGVYKKGVLAGWRMIRKNLRKWSMTFGK